MELKSSNRKRCEICIEFKSSKEMFVNKDRCAHSICTDCIVKHIIARVEDNVAEIRCPYWFTCKQILDPHTCRKIIPKSLFVKWCDVLCNLAIQPNKKSYCPNKKCLELVINECGGIVKRSECPKCKQLYCFQCNLQWPECNNCERIEENDQIFKEIAVSKKWVKCPTCDYHWPECNNCERIEENDQIFKELAVSKKWVKCPTCDYHVERISGCRHMSCRCGTTFCYKCGRKPTIHWCNCVECYDFLPLLLLVYFELTIGANRDQVEEEEAIEDEDKEEAAVKLDGDDCTGSFTGFVEGSGRICGLKGKNRVKCPLSPNMLCG
nr:probable E3 ubiquitin-protein ligase RNF217 [Quercus suber]